MMVGRLKAFVLNHRIEWGEGIIASRHSKVTSTEPTIMLLTSAVVSLEPDCSQPLDGSFVFPQKFLGTWIATFTLYHWIAWIRIQRLRELRPWSL